MSDNSLQSRSISAAAASRPPRGTPVYLAAALLFVTGVYACCRGAPLVWDGSYQLNVTLIGQKPYVYLTRFHTLILWQPVVLVSRFTSNLPLVWMAYGMPFLIAPVIAVLVSWWMVRRHAPWLMLWVLFGVAISPLPGQIFIINDSIFQQHLFWPLFMTVFVPLDAKKWLVLAMLAVFEFAHPIGLVFFFGIAASSAALALFEPKRRQQLAVRAVLGILLGSAALWKTTHWVDPYAASEANWKSAWQCWQGGVKEYPIAGLSFLWLAGAVLFAIRRTLLWHPQHPLTRRLWLLPFLPAAIGAAIWIYWALDEHRWAWASEYRRWVVPLSMPFYLMCWMDYTVRKLRPKSDAAAFPDQAWLPVLAGVFALVLGIQSSRYGSMIGRLRANLDATPGAIVPDSVADWRAHTPMQHWSITDLAIAIQGKKTQKLLASPEWVRLLYGTAKNPDYTPGSGMPQILPPVFPNYTIYPHPPAPNTYGWYDMRPVLRELPPPNPWQMR